LGASLTYKRKDLVLDVPLEVWELRPTEDRDHAVSRDPYDIAVLLRLDHRVPDLPVRQVVIVERRGAEPLAIERELRDVGEIDVVEEKNLGHLEVLFMEPLQRLRRYPSLHYLSQAHEQRLAHLVGDVVGATLLVEDCEEEALPEEVESEGRFVRPDEWNLLPVLVDLKDRVEGEGPFEGLLGYVQVGYLREEAEAVALDPHLLFELEVFQLGGHER